ncbi:MAG: response regulator [Nitrospira sp.]|nr:response regulator [Nitrospira sp.]
MVRNRVEERIIILAPIGRDAPAMAKVLTTQGLDAIVCGTALDTCHELTVGGAVLLVTEESLELPHISHLLHHLKAQPPWSELPMIVLTRGGESRLARLLDLVAEAAGSITLLERPIGEATLMRSIEVGLRSRRRQYQVRDLLEQEALSQQQLRESEQQYRTLFESIDQGFCTIEMLFDEDQEPVDYRFLLVNPAFAVQTGLRDVVGRQMRDIVPQHEDQWFRIYGNIATTGEPLRFEKEAKALNRHYEIYAWRIGTPSEQKVAILFNDITQRKASQVRLEQFAEELERKVSERTYELVCSQQQLRALATELNLAEQRERTRLAAELHDHLAQMLVLVRLRLGQAKAGPLPHSIQMIKQAEDVVDESLTYTRNLVAELSPPVLHEFGLFVALRWLGEQMLRYHLEVTVRINVPEELKLPENQAVLVFQSVRELLLNAVKHAGSKQAALVAASAEGVLSIIVEDSGVGFDPNTLSAQKLAAMSSKFGLFSIRQRMEALGGRLELRSQPGEGTKATLVLPISPPSQQAHDDVSLPKVAPCASGTGAFKSGPYRVLVADDHAMVRQGLCLMLDACPDIEVIAEASNGQEALELARRLKPSVVVIDINMPLMNGIEATAQIRTALPDTVVIGMSVNASVDNQEAMRTAGASILLPKEAAGDQLYGAIQSAMKGSADQIGAFIRPG